MRYTKKLQLLAILLAGAAGSAQAQESVLPADAGKKVVSAVNAELINPLTQREWVQLSSEGLITGSFGRLAADGSTAFETAARVTLTRDGKVVSEAMTDSSGRFALAGVAPGTYGLVARSSASVAAFALHVLPNGSSQTLPSDLDVFGASSNGMALEALLRRNLVPGSMVASVGGFYRDFMEDPLGDQRIVSKTPVVRLRDGNVLVGRVSKPGWKFSDQDLTGSTAYVLQNGKMVASAKVERDGFFKIANFSAGLYDLVVTGDDGVAVTGFSVVSSNAQASNVAADGSRFVSFNQAAGDTVQVELLNPTDYYGGSSEALPPGPTDDGGMFVPMGGGGFAGPGGGGAGGGGAGGGGLGLGGLLGIGGLAAGVAALASSDDNTTPPPASPVTP